MHRDPLIRVDRRNDLLRLRLINTASARILSLATAVGDGNIVAHDGMPLAPLDDVSFAPVQRTDFVSGVTGPITFDLWT